MMDRKTIMQGFLRIFIPMLCGEIVGAIVGTTVGTLLGLGTFNTLFFIVLPIMAGGVGEGAIPLSIGFSEIMHMEQGVAFARIIPMVMLGSLTAILTAGILNHIGKRKPHLTGEGRLMPGSEEEISSSSLRPATSPSSAWFLTLRGNLRLTGGTKKLPPSEENAWRRSEPKPDVPQNSTAAAHVDNTLLLKRKLQSPRTPPIRKPGKD